MELKYNYKISIVRVIILSVLFILCSCKSHTGYYSIPDFKGGNEIFFTLKNVSYEEIKDDPFGKGGIIVTGTFINEQKRQFDTIYITAYFYDKRGEYIGDSNTAKYENVKPNERFQFEITVPYAVQFKNVNQGATGMSVTYK